MKCIHCGEEIANDSVFCEHCGKKTDGIQSIEDRMLMIMDVASHNSAFSAAFNARSKCYSLMKKVEKRPDYKEYVQHIQLQNYPIEYYKSLFFSRACWCLGIGVISLFWAIVGWYFLIDSFPPQGYDYPSTEWEWLFLAIPATIFWGVTLWIIHRERKKLKEMIGKIRQTSL